MDLNLEMMKKTFAEKLREEVIIIKKQLDEEICKEPRDYLTFRLEDIQEKVQLLKKDAQEMESGNQEKYKTIKEKCIQNQIILDDIDLCGDETAGRTKSEITNQISDVERTLSGKLS